MDKPKGSLISYFSRRVSLRGGINLAQGKPGFSPPGPLIELLNEYAKEPGLHQYAPGNGDHKLLELIRGSHVEDPRLTEKNLVVVQGATEGLFLTFFYLTTRLSPPYSVLSCDPPYESYPELARIFDLPYVPFDLSSGMSPDFDRLERTVIDHHVKIVFLASPGNPLGKIWNAEELDALLRLARRHDFYLIFDAVYRDIYFQNPPADPMTGWGDPEIRKRLFYIHSFSKMLSITGWRVGYVIADGEHMARIRAIHDYTGLSAPHLFQAAIAGYLENFNYGTDYVAAIRGRCTDAYRVLGHELRSLGFDVPDIQGGYFVWAKLPRAWRDGFQFADQLYGHTGLAVVPGENFSPTKKDYIRLNMAVETDPLRRGMAKLREFIETFPSQS